MEPALKIGQLSYSYPQQGKKAQASPKQALKEISLTVQQGSFFALLGPNGGGKTTLFKILSTLMPLQSGEISLLGHDYRTAASSVREQLGIVFQFPSVDKKLTVQENLQCQGALYGLGGSELKEAIERWSSRLGLNDRLQEDVEDLSGGLQRRVELAKVLLHNPKVLLLDEPSTGLDPRARNEFLKTLKKLNENEGVTILLTTHYLDEAAAADHVMIVDEGSVITEGAPKELCTAIGHDVVEIQTSQTSEWVEQLKSRYDLCPIEADGRVVVEILDNAPQDAAEVVSKILHENSLSVEKLHISRPDLEAVFLHHTGKHWHWEVTDE